MTESYGGQPYLGCVAALISMQKQNNYTAQQKFSTDFNLMPHFEQT